MANKPYDNFYLSNEVEDQYNSHLNLEQFCKIDNNLVGTAGMKRIIHKYSATNGTEKLTQGKGNSKSIAVTFTPVEYEIQLAQNRFPYYDEEDMKDPVLVPVGMAHMGTDLFNTQNADIYGEFKKCSMAVAAAKFDFDVFANAQAMLNLENLEGVDIFAFVCADDVAELRKNLKDTLQYIEAFAKKGYIGTVAGVNIYTKKDATPGTIVLGTREAVTLFNKKGTEIEQERDANTRLNEIYARKYYFVALTDDTKAVRIVKGAATVTEDSTVQKNTVYYKKSGLGYVATTPATANPHTEGLFVIG